MNNPIPTPLRAVAGLAAATIDEARRLPDRLVGLPVLAVSTALQTSLKLQQRYADLVIRGDALLAQLRPEPDDAPAWAQFDDEPLDEEPADAEPLDTDSAGAGSAGTEVPATDAPPVAGYDELTVPQLRGRLRSLSAPTLAALLQYEEQHAARPPYLTMLRNRLDALAAGA